MCSQLEYTQCSCILRVLCVQAHIQAIILNREKVLGRIDHLEIMCIYSICLHFFRKQVMDNSKRRAYFQLARFGKG